MDLTKIAKGYGLPRRYDLNLRSAFYKRVDIDEELKKEDIAPKKRIMLERESHMLNNVYGFTKFVSMGDSYNWESCEKMNGFVEWFFEEYNLFEIPDKGHFQIIKYPNLFDLYHHKVDLFPKEDVGIDIYPFLPGNKIKIYRSGNVIYEDGDILVKDQTRTSWITGERIYSPIGYTRIEFASEEKVRIGFGHFVSEGVNWFTSRNYNLRYENLNKIIDKPKRLFNREKLALFLLEKNLVDKKNTDDLKLALKEWNVKIK